MKRILLPLLAFLCSIQTFAFDYSSKEICLKNNYLKEWGKLKLVGNQLSSENGQPVQLRGWSTHGHQWGGYECYNEESDFIAMKGFGANIARIAMYVTQGGWLNYDWVKNCIKWTSDNGMYCLVDFHVLKPGDPTDGEYSGAKDFFDNISKFVNDNGYKNVIYEICNEPNEDTEGNIYRPVLWESIKEYADGVLPRIAKNDPNAIVIVGCPQWDQALVHPLEDPIKNDYGLQLMYSFHYYACKHEQYLGGLMAAAGSLPIFVTEWGTTEHLGEKGFCKEPSDKLIDVCRGLNLGNQLMSWCNWSFSNVGGESASLNSANNYQESNFTQAGKYIYGLLREGDVKPSKEPKTTPYQGVAQKISASGESILRPEKYDVGGEGVAYHEYDADWIFEISPNCNAGSGSGDMDRNFRPGECVDVTYTDTAKKEFCNVGYIVEGEWLRYTVDVEKAGYYELIPYANAHMSTNIISISVDGRNAIVDLNDKNSKNKIGAVIMEVNKPAMSSGGYNNWKYTRYYSNYDDKDDKKTKYGIYFDKPGLQTISFAFMTECAGFGPVKFVPEVSTLDESIDAEIDCNIYPNPTTGQFNISVDGVANVQIVDIFGKTCWNGVVENNGCVNTNLNKGVYFVKVNSEKGATVKKLMVK